jgi:hypothetical protein
MLANIIFGGPHYTRKYMKAILVNDSEHEETIMHMNPMHALNYLVMELEDSINKFSIVNIDLVRLNALRQGKLSALYTLMYVKIRVNDKEITSMLDFGATNILVVDRLVTQLELQLSNNYTAMKALNAKAQRIMGTTYSTEKVVKEV